MKSKRLGALAGGFVLFASLLLGLSACGSRGSDGRAYLALDWTYTPKSVYFPMLPPVISAGTYYQHPAGTYYGEYTAWNWDFYSFWYTLTINEGTYGYGSWPGEDGADRFYLIYLTGGGPELYCYELSYRALEGLEAPGPGVPEGESSPPPGSEADRQPTLRSDPRSPEPGRYDLDNPEEFRREYSGPGWSLILEGKRYPPREDLER